MPASHHSVFFTGRMPFLPWNQQHQTTEGKNHKNGHKNLISSEILKTSDLSTHKSTASCFPDSVKIPHISLSTVIFHNICMFLIRDYWSP